MIKTVLQIERSECGLACLAMILGFNGGESDIFKLRSKIDLSSEGTNLSDLIRIGKQLGLNSTPVKADLADMDNIDLPCILHWNLNHYVVLEGKRGHDYIIHDPAIGCITISKQELSASYTGIALEIGTDSKLERPVEKKNGLLFLINKTVDSKTLKSFKKLLSLSLGLEFILLSLPLMTRLIIDGSVNSYEPTIQFDLIAISSIILMIVFYLYNKRAKLIAALEAIISVQSSTKVLEKLYSLPMKYFLRRDENELTLRADSANHILSTIVLDGMQIAISTISVLFLFGLLIYIDSLLSFISFCFFMGYSYLNIKMHRHNFEKHNKEGVAEGLAKSTNIENIRAFQAIKGYQALRSRMSLWLARCTRQYNSRYSANISKLQAESQSMFLFGMLRIIIASIAGFYISKNLISFGDLFAILIILELLSIRLVKIIEFHGSCSSLNVHIDRINDVMQSESEYVINSSYDSFNKICARKLSFSHSDYERKIFSDLNLTINKGEVVAIDGKSGAGKSTLLKVLSGLYQQTEGELSINESFRGAAYVGFCRENIRGVYQDDTLLTGTILENVTFNSIEIDNKKIEDALEISCCNEFISNNPMGVYLHVGVLGKNFSGGQKQRLMIARAIYAQPKILIMDEATSQLDYETEFKIFTKLKELNITLIIVSHRKEILNFADRVIHL